MTGSRRLYGSTVHRGGYADIDRFILDLAVQGGRGDTARAAAVVAASVALRLRRGADGSDRSSVQRIAAPGAHAAGGGVQDFTAVKKAGRRAGMDGAVVFRIIGHYTTGIRRADGIHRGDLSVISVVLASGDAGSGRADIHPAGLYGDLAVVDRGVARAQAVAGGRAGFRAVIRHRHIAPVLSVSDVSDALRGDIAVSALGRDRTRIFAEYAVADAYRNHVAVGTGGVYACRVFTFIPREIPQCTGITGDKPDILLKLLTAFLLTAAMRRPAIRDLMDPRSPFLEPHILSLLKL